MRPACSRPSRCAADGKGFATDELLGRIVTFGHGTTQATNALIERSGAVTGLITTRGFGDTIGLQRLMGFTAGMSVDELGWYSKRRYPDPIIPRALRREVPERVDQAGNVSCRSTRAPFGGRSKSCRPQGVETFAVVFLWSFRNPGP